MLKQKNYRVVFLFLVLATGAVWVSGVQAQEQSKSKTAAASAPPARVPGRGRRGHVSTAGTKKPAETKLSHSPTQVAPAALVSNGQAEYLSGEANVTVKGN